MHASVAEWTAFVGAVGTLIRVIAAAAVKIIEAVHGLTETVQRHEVNAQVRHAETLRGG